MIIDDSNADVDDKSFSLNLTYNGKVVDTSYVIITEDDCELFSSWFAIIKGAIPWLILYILDKIANRHPKWQIGRVLVRLIEKHLKRKFTLDAAYISWTQ